MAFWTPMAKLLAQFLSFYSNTAGNHCSLSHTHIIPLIPEFHQPRNEPSMPPCEEPFLLDPVQGRWSVLCKLGLGGRASTRAAEFFARYAFPRRTVGTSRIRVHPWLKQRFRQRPPRSFASPAVKYLSTDYADNRRFIKNVCLSRISTSHQADNPQTTG